MVVGAEEEARPGLDQVPAQTRPNTVPELESSRGSAVGLPEAALARGEEHLAVKAPEGLRLVDGVAVPIGERPRSSQGAVALPEGVAAGRGAQAQEEQRIAEH